ncbi:MAG: hypothetical protein ABUL41_01125 [Chitinophagaceae bacterium]
MSNRLITIIVFIFFYSLIVFRWLKIPIADTTTQARVGVYGDAFSSRNVHSSAMWFTDMGYRKTKALPVFNYTGNKNQDGIEVYTHYPPLPDILGGLYSRLLNTKSARPIAIFPILLSIFFFFFLQSALKKIIPDPRATFFSWLMLVTSCYFICWADDLHQHLYTELLKWFFIWLLYRFYTEEKKKWMLPALCLLYFIQSLITFEAIPFLAIVTIGFSLIFTKKIFSSNNFLLLLMPVLGVALHLFQNYLYLGSWHAVADDMRNAFLKRATGDLSNELGRAVTANDFVRMWTYELWFRIGRMFTLSAIPFIVAATFALYHFYKQNRAHFKMAITFFIAGIAWIFIMPQHALVHTFTVKHLAVFVAFVSGYGMVKYFQLLRQHLLSKQYLYLILHFAFIGWTVYSFAFNQVYYVYVKFGFGYPHFGTNASLW